MSWSWVTNADLSHISAAVPWQMRFADESDGWISGYVESPHLYSTHDGGHTWREVHLPGTGTKLGGIGSLEATSGWVYAEVATGAEPNTGGPAELYRSEVSRDAWQPVPGVMTPVAGEPGSLSIADGAIWATFHPMTVEQGGGLRTGSTLFRSLDGISWRSVPLPCAEATVADGAALGREEAIVTCSGGSAAGSQKKTAFRTQDAGATFVAIADPPFTGHIWSVGGAPGTLALGMVAAETTIDVSRDDGQSWTVVFDRPDGGEGISFLGFTTPRLAEAIVGGIFPPSTLALVMSRDGGSHWSVVTIHPS